MREQGDDVPGHGLPGGASAVESAKGLGHEARGVVLEATTPADGASAGLITQVGPVSQRAISSTDLALENRVSLSLGKVPTDAQARVLRVPDRDPKLLRYLGEIGLVPEAVVRVLRREPLNGPLLVTIQSKGSIGSEGVVVDGARQ